MRIRSPFGQIITVQPISTYEPIPESEITRIWFDREWIIKNDLDSDPYNVCIAFPKSCVINGKSNSYVGLGVELVVPTQLLFADNFSKDQEQIKVQFPNAYFNGLPKPPNQVIPLPNQDVDITNTILSLPYEERIEYHVNQGETVTGFKGRIVPAVYNNINGETLLTYHEIEFYSTGNEAVEIINAYEDSQNHGHVGFIYYPDSSGVFQQWVLDNITLGTSVYYYFMSYSSLNYTQAYMQINGSWMGYQFTDSSTPTIYDELQGSSELDPKGGIQQSFQAFTLPITVTSLLLPGGWCTTPVVVTKLHFDSFGSSAAYVGVSGTLDYIGLSINAWATN